MALLLIQQEGHAKLLVAGGQLLPQPLPLGLVQRLRRQNQANAGRRILDRHRAQLHHQAPEGLLHGLPGGQQVLVADAVVPEIILHTAKAGDQQVHLSAVPQVLVVGLKGPVPVRRVHPVPVDGGRAQQGHPLPAEDRDKVHGDLRAVKIDPGKIQAGVLHRQIGDQLIVVPVGDIEIGVGDLLDAGIELADHIIGVGPAEQQGVKLPGVLLVEKFQVVRGGIGQVGDISVFAHLAVDLHDAAQRLLICKNSNRIHGTLAMIFKFDSGSLY